MLAKTSALARIRHQGRKRPTNLGRVAATILECRGMAHTPAYPFCANSRVRRHAHTAKRMTEQTRTKRMPSFVRRNPPILLLGSPERRKQVVILVTFFNGIAHSNTPAAAPLKQWRGCVCR